MRTIVIGDVHGCLKELDLLLASTQPRFDDRIIIAGDLVDRGPDSPGVVKFCRENKIESVAGNHDIKHVKWHRNEARALAELGYKNKMQPFDPVRLAEHNALSDLDHAYLASLPDTISFTHNDKPFIVVHGGLLPNVPIEHQPQGSTCRLTWIDQYSLKPAHIRGSFACPPNGVYWATKWTGPQSVIYGHYVDNLKDIRFNIHQGYTCYGIDTGACFQGHLTSMVLEEGKDITYVQVKSLAKYAHRDIHSGDIA